MRKLPENWISWQGFLAMVGGKYVLYCESSFAVWLGDAVDAIASIAKVILSIPFAMVALVMTVVKVVNLTVRWMLELEVSKSQKKEPKVYSPEQRFLRPPS